MSEEQNHIILNELKQTLSQNVIHYEPTRVDYTINDSELNLLGEIGKSVWKEVFFAAVGVAIPTIANGIVAQRNLTAQASFTTEIFINYLIGGVCLILSIIACSIWRYNSKKQIDIIDKITKKPKFILPP